MLYFWNQPKMEQTWAITNGLLEQTIPHWRYFIWNPRSKSPHHLDKLRYLGKQIFLYRYKLFQYQSITYSVKHFNCQFHRVLIKCLSLWFLGTRITSALLCHCLLCLSPLTPAWKNFLLLRKSLLGIQQVRSRWKWASAQTYKETR